MRTRLVAGTVALTPSIAAATASAGGPAPRLMPLGDSITAGVGGSTSNGYRSQLYNDLVGEGHSGWGIDQLAGIAHSVLARYKPNVITLHIGTNDLHQPCQPTTAASRVLVASLIPTTSGTENRTGPRTTARSRAWSSQSRRLASLWSTST